MEKPTIDTSSVDAYIASFPPEIQEQLQAIRATIRAAAPDAEEKISYAMPTFAQHGNLVHYAAAKQHIGLYPASSGVAVFKDELAQFGGTKGSIHLPLHGPQPLDLIRRIVRFRVEENVAKAANKSRKKRD